MSEQYPASYGGSPSGYARPTDVVAVLGLVFAFVFWPAGLVLSIIGLQRTKRNGTGGRGLALAGLIVSIVAAVLAVGFVVLVLVARGVSTAP